jgi:VWFA-related protein
MTTVVAAVVAWSAFPLAQVPPPAEESTESQAAEEQVVDQPTFRVAVDLVTTDVIVRDSSGLFVPDLDKAEFIVKEDGVEQEVSSLVLVHGGRAYNQLLPPPPPAEEGIILPPPRPPTDTAGRIFLFFIDDLHLDFQNTPRIRQLFKKISATLVHEGDMFAMVSTGPSSIEVGLTYDHALLDATISRVRGYALTPQDIMDMPEGIEGPSEVRWRTHVAFSTAYDMIKNLEDIKNRRKAVIYISNGYDLDPFPEGRLGIDPLFGSSDPFQEPDRMFSQQRGTSGNFADADMQVQLAELTRAANRANATMYSIDPRGLVGGVDIDQRVSSGEFFNYIRKSQDTLRVLAEETGGIAVVNQNDFDAALKRIDAETSDYYVLGYYSNNPDPRRRTREIKVETTRESVDVWSRTSYTMRRPGGSASGRQ